jgi:hypothetical protein
MPSARSETPVRARVALLLLLAGGVGTLMLVFGAGAAWANTFPYACTNSAADQGVLQGALTSNTYNTINITGTCLGHFIAPRSLTLNGPATLNGGPSAGTTLTITGNATIVSASNLLITGGMYGTGGGYGVLVSPGSTLTLTGSSVTGNAYAGISVSGSAGLPAVLTLNQSSVSLNVLGLGGIVGKFAVITLNSSQVFKNHAYECAGGISLDGLTLVLNNSSVFLNTGGGISNDAVVANSTVTLGPNSYVDQNSGCFYGGGIQNFARSPFTAKINSNGVGHDLIGNTALVLGGGVYNAAMPGGTANVVLAAPLVLGNTAPGGGGIYNDNTAGTTSVALTNVGSVVGVVSANIAGPGGGGACANAVPGPSMGLFVFFWNTVPQRVNGC